MVSSLRGFTLIELSIVLVIIGLIVGGVLVGQDLIRAANVRAQVTQMEKLNTAVNTFKTRYNGYLPGDIPEPYASQFGLLPRGPYSGEGDGDGQLTGIGNPPTSNNQHCGIYQRGENTLFWVDLSTAKLIDNTFTTATAVPGSGFSYTPNSSPSLSAYYPQAKIGQGNYIYAWSGGPSLNGRNFSVCLLGGDHNNYLGIQAMRAMDTYDGTFTASPGMTVNSAYNIDKKIDDGLPQSGNVLALYVTYYDVLWAIGGTPITPPTIGNSGAAGANNIATTAATNGSSLTCYDNNNVSGMNQQYSITQNNGNGVNCALSFKIK